MEQQYYLLKKNTLIEEIKFKINAEHCKLIRGLNTQAYTYFSKDDNYELKMALVI